jgi:hypothetical protein
MFTAYFPPARLNPGRAWFVAKLDSDHSGLSWNTARNSLQSAIDLTAPGDTIYIGPGVYDESVIIPAGLAGLSIIGVGPTGSIEFAPSDLHASSIINNSDNVLLQNVKMTCPDTTSSVALTNTGAGFRCMGCVMQGGAMQVLQGPGTVTEINALYPTAGTGNDAIYYDCVLQNGPSGVTLQGTDYGPPSSVVFASCRFLKLTSSAFEEKNLLGSPASQFRNLLIKDCTFEPAEDGTEPTAYILLDDDNGNSGMVTGCHFTVALNSGKNLVSTKVIWVGNFHPAGLSTAQPS